MLKQFLNSKVKIHIPHFVETGFGEFKTITGVITQVDDEFVVLDNKNIIAIKYISRVTIL